jgi:hypothetical protein
MRIAGRFRLALRAVVPGITPDGVPEDICAHCNSKVANKLKAKGDWCDEHGVPESQCFVCNPEFEKKFAAQYEAKYGKQPPPRDTEGAEERGYDGA